MLLHETQYSLEVTHVFAHHERCVSSLHLFVVLQSCCAHLALSPSAILGISQVILCANKHCGGHFDFSKIDVWRSRLTVLLFVLLRRAPVVEGNFICIYNLGIVHDALNTSTCGEVPHVYLKAVFIVKLRVVSNQEAFH